MAKTGVRIALATAGATAIWCVAPSAWAGAPAGGAIGYGPLGAAAAVPSLGAWSLLLMALLVAAVAYRALRGRANGRLMAHLLLAGGLAGMGLAGQDVIGIAKAVAGADHDAEFNQAGGGTVYVQSGITKITNTSGVPQKVLSMNPSDEGFTFDDPGPDYTPECKVGLVVNPTADCYVSGRYLD